jgi:hypothetical protein
MRALAPVVFGTGQRRYTRRGLYPIIRQATAPDQGHVRLIQPGDVHDAAVRGQPPLTAVSTPKAASTW